MPVAMSARPDPSSDRVRLISVSVVVRFRLAVRSMDLHLAWGRPAVQRLEPLSQGNRVKEYVTNLLDADSIRFLRFALRKPAWTAHPPDARHSTKQSFS
jgi:hypothetical protein